jgi:hypothetical protein
MNYHSKNDFLIKWFELFHRANFSSDTVFNRDLLFNDKYLSQLLSLGIPSEFHHIDSSDLTTPQLSAAAALKVKKDETQIELKLFTSLKLFFKEKELDLTEVLK